MDKKFHCDGYYLSCSERGVNDIGDIRYDRDGLLKLGRSICLSNGVSPLNNKICNHCIEAKKLFRRRSSGDKIKCPVSILYLK